MMPAPLGPNPGRQASRNLLSLPDTIIDREWTVISREDFIFTIGYDGDRAIVDGKAKREYGKLGTMELAEEGLYRAAFSSALYSKNEAEMKEFIDFFNIKAGTTFKTAEEVRRLFGVNEFEISRTLVL